MLTASDTDARMTGAIPYRLAGAAMRSPEVTAPTPDAAIAAFARAWSAPMEWRDGDLVRFAGCRATFRVRRLAADGWYGVFEETSHATG